METLILRSKLAGKKQMTWWVLKVEKCVGFLKESVPSDGGKFSFTSNFHMTMILPKASKYTSNWLTGSTVQRGSFTCGKEALENKDGGGLQFIILRFKISKIANLVLV